MSTSQVTPQTTSPDAWGQAAAELGPQNSTQPQAQSTAQPQTTDAWGQAQAELNGQQSSPSGPGTPEEQAFLQKNPNYTYVKADPKFPNRQEGIYHKDEAGLNDKEMEHHPVDLHFAEHTAEGAGTAAAATGLAAGLPAAGEAALNFAKSEAGKDLMKLVLKHTGEKLLTGAGIGVGYAAIHQAAKLLGLD